MATHSSILAWRIPWIEEPGGLVYGVTKSCVYIYIYTHTVLTGPAFFFFFPWEKETFTIQGSALAQVLGQGHFQNPRMYKGWTGRPGVLQSTGLQRVGHN